MGGEGKGNGGGTKGTGSGRGEGSGSGSGGAKGEHGSGTGGGGGGSGTGAGSSKSNPVQGGTCHIPTPKYPDLSLQQEEEGLVVLEAIVAPGGKVDPGSVKVTKSSRYNRLDSVAKKAVKAGSCHASVWTRFTIPIRFILPN